MEAGGSMANKFRRKFEINRYYPAKLIDGAPVLVKYLMSGVFTHGNKTYSVNDMELVGKVICIEDYKEGE